MIALYYGTSVETASEIVDFGFRSQRDEIVLLPDADEAHLSAWLSVGHMPTYAILQTYYAGLRSNSRYCPTPNTFSVPQKDLAKLVVMECLIYNMKSGEPLGVIRKDP